jgi:hypothetical protein
MRGSEGQHGSRIAGIPPIAERTQRPGRSAVRRFRKACWFSALQARQIRWPLELTRRFSPDNAWPRLQHDLAVLRAKAMFSACVTICR